MRSIQAHSINYEDGEPRFAKVLELAKRFGAGVVIGTIDEEGMARTAEGKFRIAKRSYEQATTTCQESSGAQKRQMAGSVTAIDLPPCPSSLATLLCYLPQRIYQFSPSVNNLT